MTAPTEDQIRAYMEAYRADPEAYRVDGERGTDDNWGITFDTLVHHVGDSTAAFSDLIEEERVPDDDFGVFVTAYHEEIKAMMPNLNAALRPLMIEAQVRATVRFFERFPHVPLAKVPA